MRFPPTAERFERLEEILQIAHRMWSGNTTAYEGRHYKLPYPVNTPQPLTKPHPPILIGGMGPKKTLRFVAEYADGCNFFGGSKDELLKERLETLKGHCDDVGRSYSAIEKTVLQTADFVEGGPQDAIARGRALSEMGFEHLIFNIKGHYDPASLAHFTEEIIPALKS